MNKRFASLLIAVTTLMSVAAHAADSDNDGVLDSSDPCINSGAHDFARKPKLKMKNLGTPGGGGCRLLFLTSTTHDEALIPRMEREEMCGLRAFVADGDASEGDVVLTSEQALVERRQMCD